LTSESEPQEDFDTFVARRRGDWIRAAMRIVRNPADAEDVVQDTLISVWRHWGNASLRNPEGYVYRAVTLNALKRRSKRRDVVPLDGIADPAAAERPVEAIDAFELERAIEKLSPAQQMVVRTKFYLGLTFSQIGKNLSISSNTAASRCRYALAALRKSLTAAEHPRQTNNERTSS
jgi:RNA polymerase sigma-70 factor (ECF subfamily)